MNINPIDVASIFIALNTHDNKGVMDHLRLQKLVYFTYGWWLAFKDKPLFQESPKVWKYGPVFSSLFDELSYHGMKSIDHSESIQRPLSSLESTAPSGSGVREIIDWIWLRYGHLSTEEISRMAHEEGSPWQIEASRNNYSVPINHPIPVALVREYFKKLKMHHQMAIYDIKVISGNAR